MDRENHTIPVAVYHIGAYSLLLYTRTDEQHRIDLYAVAVGLIWPEELLTNNGTVVTHFLV